MSRRHKENGKICKALEAIVPGSIAGVSTLPDGGKSFGLRVIRELPDELSHVTFGHRPSVVIVSSENGVWDNRQKLRDIVPGEVQYDSDRSEVLELALAIAGDTCKALKAHGIEVEYKEHFLLLSLPPFGIAQHNERGWAVRPSEKHLAMLRSITGPGDLAYDHIQEQLRLLDYFEWVESNSPFEDDHWRPIKYHGIAVHLKGVIPADHVKTIF